MTAHSEQAELEQLKNLDSRTISVIFDRYYPEIFRFIAYRLDDKNAAEDIASEVFVRLLEAIEAKRSPQTNLKAWLLATASHMVNDHLRKKYRHPTDTLPETVADKQPGMVQIYEEKESEHRLKSALAKLTEEQQNVITLRFNHAYSLDETASLMNKNVNAIKQLQFRALAALQRVLGKQP